MSARTGAQVANQVNLQGIVVPAGAINPREFMARTRRLKAQQRAITFASASQWGSTENVQLLQAGIVTEIQVRFTGDLVVTLGGGTCAASALWPYGLLRNVRFNANGQTNLINSGGWDLKVRDMMARTDLSDRGVSKAVGASTITQGSLSQNSELWGVGQSQTGITGAPTTYPVDLVWNVPVAMDPQSFIGAIFAQTTATDLVLTFDFANQADLFTLTGAATAVLTGSFEVVPTLFSIPAGPDGGIVVPDLSVFHSMIRTRQTSLSNGDNEIRLVGQGVGKQLQRLFFRTFNGSTSAPLAMNATNYGNLAWRYGQNDTPEIFPNGQHMRYYTERMYNCDIGVQGYGCWDFVHESSFRDSVDMGAASELRLLANIPAGVTLTNPYLDYVQETLFMGATAL